ncbi:hypothetical protein LTR62_000543 [Meristemomyces frigidus]|uniref:GH64 domain-containing protein n=1 Tax=Meristemomyces frigidus TaxID=1508187 RepID=A0AAN7TAC2_9PEZI|nr:hypothetical protein LTR62_000543 [Meristemomyces frigidus]
MPESLQIALKNDSDLPNLHAYITGIALQHNGQRCLLKSDGQSLYFPQNPPAIGSPLTEDCAIPLGAPGTTTNVTIPQIAGGRIWFAEGELTFLLNPGDQPALVEPSVLNASDPNAGVNFGFAEFTLNADQLYANISYVDFTPRLPVALTLQQGSGDTQHVAGMPPDGLENLAAGLREQSGKDGRPWAQLVVEREGKVLRCLNATHGDAVGAGFSGYYEGFIEEVWRKYGSDGVCMKIDTQAGPGVLEGRVVNGELRVGDERFGKPNSADVFGCNTRPFTTGPSATRNAIIPRLAAAFHRSTLLAIETHPSEPSTFYPTDPTNHYARLVHACNVDRKGYAFAYDDVQPDGGEDQSGKVNAGDPVLLTVTVGGKSAGAGAPPPSSSSQQPQSYDRGPPPPPPDLEQQPMQDDGGLKGKLRGFAGKMFK